MLLGTQRISADGHLEIGGCDSVKLAQDFGTPLYVMDEECIRKNCREYKLAFKNLYPKNEISFASKAYLNMAICKLMNEEGLGLDVASSGELHTAMISEFPPEKILFHGNNKSEAELQMALDYGVGRIVVDNILELRMLAKLAKEGGSQQRIFIRVTPGIDPHTHRRIRTGQEDTKFGLSIASGAALEAIIEAREHAPHIDLTGIHCHIGSQLLDTLTHEQAIDVMVAFMRKIIDTTGWTPTDLDIGGGLGIRYVEDQQPPSIDTYSENIVRALIDALEANNVPKPTLWQEPGRSLVGEAGTTLYTIGAIKVVPIPEAPGLRTYVSVDGGMSDNPRPQLYDAIYNAVIANKMHASCDKNVTIAGKHCETDILIPSVLLGEFETGDLLAVQSTGAYNYSMASNYNRFMKPACVFVLNGAADLVSRRESLADVTRLDIVPSRFV